MSESNYLEINKDAWNRKTEVHLNSDFYAVEDFLKGNSSLNEIELKLLGDVSGKSILHLQCHFGLDTLSLARLGAKVTGVDISDTAIKNANLLAEKTNINTQFICCDIYSLAEHLNEQFDIVYTSYGTIGWLPDLHKWAAIISKFLKPTGKFIFVEFHPVVWMFDDNFDKIQYHYLKNEAIIETVSGTYADRDAPIKLETISWNHGISEVLNSLIQNNLVINLFEEYDYSPYNCFKETEEFESKKFRIKHLGNKIPMVYAIVASKK